MGCQERKSSPNGGGITWSRLGRVRWRERLNGEEELKFHDPKEEDGRGVGFIVPHDWLSFTPGTVRMKSNPGKVWQDKKRRKKKKSGEPWSLLKGQPAKAERASHLVDVRLEFERGTSGSGKRRGLEHTTCSAEPGPPAKILVPLGNYSWKSAMGF